MILPFPLQNTLTRPMRTAAAKLGRAGYLSLWAGRGVARASGVPAGDLVKRLVGDARYFIEGGSSCRRLD